MTSVIWEQVCDVTQLLRTFHEPHSHLCFDGKFGTKVSDAVEIIISLSDLVTPARCLQNVAALYRITKKHWAG